MARSKNGWYAYSWVYQAQCKRAVTGTRTSIYNGTTYVSKIREPRKMAVLAHTFDAHHSWSIFTLYWPAIAMFALVGKE